MSAASLKDLREAVSRNPGDRRAWYALGVAALEAGSVGESCFAFAQAVYLAPLEASEAEHAADLLASAGCETDAENILLRVIESTPHRKESLARLARLLMDTGRDSQAVIELEAALRLHPRDSELRTLMAAAHQRLGALPEAAGHLRSALAVDASHPDLNRRLAAVLTQMGDHAGAVDCWRLVVMRSRGRDSGALTSLGISLSTAGQHAEALEILKEVARRNGQSASSVADLGMALLAAARLEEATAAFGRALDLDPGLAQVHCGLGIAYQRQGRLHQAVEAFRATEQLAPDDAAGPLNLGLVLQKLGDREGARRALLRAAQLEPDDRETRAALEAVFAPPEDEAPAARPSGPQDLGPSISGDLKSFPLFDVLEFLRLQRKTGSLVVSSPLGAGVVRLLGGAVTSASAPRVKRLGETLLDDRLITRPQLDLALAHQRQVADASTLPALGSVLLRKKVIDQDRLSVGIRRQLVAALEDMLTWPEGAFSFHPALDVDGPPVSFDLQDVMLKLARMADERNAGKLPRLD